MKRRRLRPRTASKSGRGGPGRSERRGISLSEILELFPDEDAARLWFERIRWKEGRFCPHCGAVETGGSPWENRSRTGARTVEDTSA